MSGDDPSGEMTLAFSLSAVDRLDDPAAAFEDARAWSRHVGVVDNDPEAVAAAVDADGLPQDFEMAPEDDVWLALERIRAATATPRHVYVGATDEDRRVATRLGWEFRHVTEAAEKAGWRLPEEESRDGILTRLRAWLPVADED